MKKFKMACGLALTMAGLLGVNAAHAATFSDQITATKDIVFNAPASGITMDIAIPDGTFTAGALANNHVVATSKINDSTGKRAGIRFSSVANQTVTGTGTNLGLNVDIKGKDNPANILKLFMNTPLTPGAWTTVGTDIYFVENAAGDDDMTYAARGAQVVAADTYVLSLDGAIYNP